MNPTIRLNFNDKQIRKAVEKEMKPTLMGAGRYVMNIVRASIHQRKDPNKSADPLHQPFAHANTGKKTKSGKPPKPNKGFKKTIVYALEEGGKAVLVGSQLVRPGMSVIAKSHEFGGSRQIRAAWEKDIDPDQLAIGDIAPVRRKYVTSRDVVLRTDRDSDPKTGQRVYWIRLRTKSQVDHSKRVFKRMRKRYSKSVMAHYPKRPFMRPGLIHATPKLATFWQNAVKK